MRIAVDAMGGDYAPGIVVEGITAALYDFPEYEITVVGHLGKLSYYLEKYGIEDHPRISKVHADEVVEMSDPSTVALRSKKRSSITECARLLKDGKVDAIVSAGHTGAAVASTKVLVRTLPGIDRPAIATSMPALSGRFILIDAGANTDCKPLNLAQFALMGEAYAKYLFGIDKPSIGILSVGGEDVKGNELTKQVFKILSQLPVNFVGNVEGDTIFENAADVVVCDGFMGNVLLKGAEGLAKTTMRLMKDFFSKNPLRMTGAMLSRNAFRELKQFGDSEQLGGAPLLGINGICVIGHGSSSSKAVRNAIRVAGEFVKFGINDKITRRIAETQSIIAKCEEQISNSQSDLSEE
ncbi:phosphate acyltransferase PlsX [Lentisphaerota bacterium ZTH]|nr:phosphate acyltransferase PlsX [Lentisphaerota bacterium]WET06656.1 phosphate acyltransferase PlsX [Lentisphaerota bacterium ZTH]